MVSKSGERSATCTGCLTVKAGPKVTTLAPSTLGQTSLNEAVKVNGTGFVTGAVVTFSGTGVTDTLTTIGPSQLTLSASVAANAALGARDVTVVQPDGGRTTCTGCFTVAIAPTITSVSPTTIARSTLIGTMMTTGTEFARARRESPASRPRRRRQDQPRRQRHQAACAEPNLDADAAIAGP